MCGRFAIGADPELVASYFDVELPEITAQPSWNVAPTDPANVICDFGDEQGRQMRIMNWGFDLVGRGGESRGKVFNARIETIASKWRFKSAAKWHRCLIPATGWYEWTVADNGKDPHYFSSKSSDSISSSKILALAGIWEEVDSGFRFTIITRPALPELSQIHNRMPLVLPASEWGKWLDPNNSTAHAEESLQIATKSIIFRNHRVSRAVNNSRNEGSDLILKL